MALNPYNPFLPTFGRSMDPFSVMEDPLFSPFTMGTVGFSRPAAGAAVTTGGSSKARRVMDYPMDIQETEQSYNVFADAPGMTPDEIHVDFNDDTRVLTVTGEHTEETQMPEGATGMSRYERVKRSFRRCFILPEYANTDAIQAKLEHGVLAVCIPKLEAPPKPPPRKIPVATAAPAIGSIETKHTGATGATGTTGTTGGKATGATGTTGTTGAKATGAKAKA